MTCLDNHRESSGSRVRGALNPRGLISSNNKLCIKHVVYARYCTETYEDFYGRVPEQSSQKWKAVALSAAEFSHPFLSFIYPSFLSPLSLSSILSSPSPHPSPCQSLPPPPLSLSLIMMSLINSPWTTIIVDGLNLLVIYSGVKRGILCLSLHLRSILTDSFINTLIFDMSIVLETKYTQQKYKMMLLAYKYISQMFCLFPQISV